MENSSDSEQPTVESDVDEDYNPENSAEPDGNVTLWIRFRANIPMQI